MKRSRLSKPAIALVLFIVASIFPPSVSRFALSATGDAVVKVFDGDTVLLKDGRRIRYLAINAPEMEHEGRPRELYAIEALTANRKLVMGQELRLEYDKERHDQYGRTLAYVYLPDGAFVNEVLVKEGLATVYATPPNLRYEKPLLTLQQRAIREKKGLWSRMEPGNEPFFLANKASRRFHRPTCHLGVKTRVCNRQKFKDRISAFYSGFSPCKKCNP